MESAAATGSGGGNGMINDASPVESTGTTGAAAAAFTPADEAKQNLTQVINSIQKTLGVLHQLYLTLSSFNTASQFLHQLYLTLSSFNTASQLPLLQRLNNLVLELDNMSKLAEKCNIQVPMEVLNLIDDGKNPDEFTRDVLNSCIAKNQITKGKTDAFKGMRRHLLEELEQAFPDEVETYREMRATSVAESKRLAQAQSMLPNGDVKVKTENI